jgi:hypothetical protein
MKANTMLVRERFCCRRYSTYVFGRYPCTVLYAIISENA